MMKNYFLLMGSSFFKRPFALISVCVCFSLFLVPQSTKAVALDEVKKRMSDRQVEVETLLRSQKVGEGEEGFLLAYLEGGSLSDEEQLVVDAENDDRSIVYEEIAKLSEMTANAVGQKRAELLRDKLIPGIYRRVPVPKGSSNYLWDDGIDGNPKLTRLLSRPGAVLYETLGGAVLEKSVSQFTMFIVEKEERDEQDMLWYKVGQRKGDAAGWIKEGDALEWHQALVMNYTNQQGRNRSLFFSNKEELLNIVKLPADERASKSAEISNALLQGEEPGNSVIAMEPVFDILTQEIPVIIPILGHERVSIDGVRDSNLLKVAASARSKADPNIGEVPKTQQIPDVDIVFVLDTTSSMGPYIDEIKDATSEFASSATAGDASIRFGLVGFRDSDPRFAKKMGYGIKNFTSELLDSRGFQKRLQEVTALKEDPGDKIPEDVFSGVQNAIDSKWRTGPGAGIRIVILVGDASGNEPYTNAGNRNPGNKLGMNKESIRQQLDDSRIFLQAIHIKVPKYSADHAKAVSDFSTLAKNPGDSGARSLSVKFNGEDFGKQVRSQFDALSKFLNSDKDEFVRESNEAERKAEGDDQAPTIGESFAGILANAYVDFVAGQNTAPLDKDFKGWVLPNDLEEPERHVMQVRLLLRRGELENLKTKVDSLLEAAEEEDSSTNQGSFFERLKLISAFAIKDPSKNSFGDFFEVPDFVADLPYRSRILGMEDGDWENFSVSQQIRFRNEWRSMSEFYEKMLFKGMSRDNKGAWRKFSKDSEEFIMIPLHLIP